MKKNIPSLLALICALLTLAVSLFCLVSLKNTKEELSARIAGLETQVARLGEEVENSTPVPEEVPGLSCSLLVDRWSAGGGALTADLFAVARLEAGLTVSRAQLYLICGEQLQIRDIEMNSGEGEDCFEADLPGTVFELPGMEEGDELVLELAVTCTGGQNIHARVSWYLEEGQLLLVSG